jgi:hypothetical protein
MLEDGEEERIAPEGYVSHLRRVREDGRKSMSTRQNKSSDRKPGNQQRFHHTVAVSQEKSGRYDGIDLQHCQQDYQESAEINFRRRTPVFDPEKPGDQQKKDQLVDISPRHGE